MHICVLHILYIMLLIYYLVMHIQNCHLDLLTMNHLKLIWIEKLRHTDTTVTELNHGL